jgi:hypothetical protein
MPVGRLARSGFPFLMTVIFSPGCHLHRWRVIRKAYYYPKAQVLHYSYRNRSTWMAAQYCACLVFWSLVRSAVSVIHTHS